MRILAILAALIMAVSAGAQTTRPAQGSDGFGPNSAYARLWNPSSIITFNGTVTGKIVAPPMAGTGDAVSLLVKQPDREAFEVHLGPQWFVSNMPTRINAGDSVMVTGSRVNLEGRTVIMAQSVIVRNKEVAFRDAKGRPLWTNLRDLPVQPLESSASGQVVDRKTVDINGVTYDVFRVDTGMGTVDIVGSPTWFSQRQDQVVQVGHNVQILGAMRPVPIGYNLYWADSFGFGSNLIVLRPF